METDKMNESQEKDSAEAMDTQEDKKEEGDAPQGIIWSIYVSNNRSFIACVNNVGDEDPCSSILGNVPIIIQLVFIKSPFSGQCNRVTFYIGSKMDL